MTFAKRLITGAAALLLLAALAAAPAAATTVTVPQGDDGWVTQGGGLTNFDLSGYPISSAFPGGSISGSSSVNLKGSPLNSSSLGSIDTIVSRTTDATATIGGAAVNANLTVRALRLVSDNSNVTITNHGTYSVKVNLSTTASSTGTMAITATNSDGGTFTSSFTIVPKLIFTNVSNPSDVVSIDCGVTTGCPSLTLSSTGTGWTRTGGSGNFSPSSKGVTIIGSGIGVDADGNGSNDYTTVGTSNFYAGFAASSGTGFPPAPGTHTAPNHSHVTLPPTDCTTQTGTGFAASAIAVKSFCRAIATQQTDTAN